MFYRLRGEPRSLQETLTTTREVIVQDIISVRENVFHLYVHVHPGEPAGKLMALARRYALIIEPPITFTDQGGIRVTVVGTHDLLQQALQHIPPDVEFTIEKAGRGGVDYTSVLSGLTDRQNEILRTAVDMGYYEIPHRTTHSEIANALGLSSSTISEHLRKAEVHIISMIMR